MSIFEGIGIAHLTCGQEVCHNKKHGFCNLMVSKYVTDLYACWHCAESSRWAWSKCGFNGYFAFNTANKLKYAEIEVSEGVAINFNLSCWKPRKSISRAIWGLKHWCGYHVCRRMVFLPCACRWPLEVVQFSCYFTFVNSPYHKHGCYSLMMRGVCLHWNTATQ